MGGESGGVDWHEVARGLDASDPLAESRAEFASPAGRIYLDGNSLGLLGKQAEASLMQAVADWRNRAIGGWLEADPPWFGLAEALGAQMAPLVGAEAAEVVVTGSTTGNLHQLLATLYRPEGGRTRIVVDALNFPSDRYAVSSHLRLRGRDPVADLVVVPSRDGATIVEADLIAALTDDVAVLVVPTVVYRSGQLLDIARLAHAGRERGVAVLVDASHSVGVVPHEFGPWKVDAAFWCSYKYLNGGPGAVAGLYLARRHWTKPPGLAGWFGMSKERQFDLGSEFVPADGAGMLQVGTPPILSMAPLIGALNTIHKAGIAAIRRKSLALTDFLRTIAEADLADLGVGCITPREADRRGGHIALTHPEAARVCRALIDGGVVPDHRPPTIVRLAPVALYTSFADVAQAMACLRAVLVERRFEVYSRERGLVSWTPRTGRIIDISTPLRHDLAGWPGDTPFGFDLAWRRSAGSSVNVGRITTSLHTGTHVDAPFHFDDAGPTVDRLDLAAFVGPARVVDARSFDPIPAAVLPDLDWAEPPRILFRTDAWLDRTRFPTRIPTLGPEVPALLAGLGIVLTGFDLPSVDALDSRDLPIHHALGSARIAILEGLDLSGVEPGVYELIALPLSIVGADGAPVRAILRT